MRSRVSSWITASWPSAVRWTSSSTASAPASTPSRKDSIVFSGASADAPRCATMIVIGQSPRAGRWPARRRDRGLVGWARRPPGTPRRKTDADRDQPEQAHRWRPGRPRCRATRAAASRSQNTATGPITARELADEPEQAEHLADVVVGGASRTSRSRSVTATPPRPEPSTAPAMRKGRSGQG